MLNTKTQCNKLFEIHSDGEEVTQVVPQVTKPDVETTVIPGGLERLVDKINDTITTF